jgi:hypothetical protein
MKLLLENWRKFFLKEELCVPEGQRGQNSGWINPDGDFPEEYAGKAHMDTAIDILEKEYQERATRFDGVQRLQEKGWVRVSNFSKISGPPPGALTAPQLSTIKSLILKCFGDAPSLYNEKVEYIYEYGKYFEKSIKESSLNNFMIALKGGTVSKVAQMRAMEGRMSLFEVMLKAFKKESEIK